MAHPKYTKKEIKEWLEGWFTFDGEGKPTGSLPLKSILILLDCEHDGIKAWKKRKKTCAD